MVPENVRRTPKAPDEERVERGRRFARARRAAKLTLKQVAEATGAAISTIGRWERGESMPRTDTLDMVAKMYSVRPKQPPLAPERMRAWLTHGEGDLNDPASGTTSDPTSALSAAGPEHVLPAAAADEMNDRPRRARDPAPSDRHSLSYQMVIDEPEGWLASLLEAFEVQPSQRAEVCEHMDAAVAASEGRLTKPLARVIITLWVRPQLGNQR